jgi:hypothetical protein
LFEVADFLHEDIDGHGGAVSDAVDLGLNTSPCNELSSIGDESGRGDADVTVNLEHLLNGFRDDEAADDALVTHKHNAVLEFQSGRGRTTLDGFASVFNLKQSSVWAKRCDAVIVSSSTWLHVMTSFSCSG